jgi:hypothetical protein
MSAMPFVSRTRLVFLRALIWGLIGLIYAPLFVALRGGFQSLGLDHGAFIPAAALAGAVGAAFYGARQVALAGAVVGLVVASLLFLVLPPPIPLWQVVLAAAVVGAVLGALVRFPDRCSHNLPGKALAGLVTGAACGGLLGLSQALHPASFNIAGAVAFLVAVNGVLYVASVRWWIGLTRPRQGQACNVIEALVISVLAAAAAGSLWVVSGPLIGIVDAPFVDGIEALLQQIPAALLGGVIGGALAGALLQALDFRWAHDV